jgi:hypothetical protein
MKNLMLISSCLLLFLTGCNSGDNNPPVTPPTASFTFDNQNYSVLPSQGINEMQMNNFVTFNDIPYNRSQISIIGLLGFSQTASIAFDLYYREGTSIAGTYTIDDEESSSFEDFVAPLDRGCMGWTSMGGVFGMSGEGVNANNPQGTVTITVNSPNNYTIHYVGNFRIYEDFEVVRTVPCVMDVTGPVVLQN